MNIYARLHNANDDGNLPVAQLCCECSVVAREVDGAVAGQDQRHKTGSGTGP